MRATAVRTAIVSAVEGIVPTSQVSTEDVFRAHDYDTPARDRAFRVDRVSPQAPARALWSSIGASPDPYEIIFEVSVIYIEGIGTTARKLEDGDLVCDVLRDLPATEAQIRNVDIRSGVDTLDPAGYWLVSWDVTIAYDRRDAL